MKKISAIVCVSSIACGGSASQTVTVPPSPSASATATASASASVPPPKRHTLAGVWSATYKGNARGMAIAGKRLYVNIDKKLHVFEDGRDVSSTPHAWKAGDALVVVGDGLFDPISFEDHTPKTPKGLDCQTIGFSADGARMSAYCFEPKTGTDAVHVYDARTSAEIAKLGEFRTAAPIRSGVITASGNFVFWTARASGAFEEIKSRVTGPVMSSHSEMSPTEDMLFTTPDKNWLTDDHTPGQMINPKNARVLFSFDKDDVTGVRFSPSGRYFAALHSSLWKDIAKAQPPGDAWITIHAGEAASFGRSSCDSTEDAAFSSDDALVAIRCSSDIDVFEIR